MRAQVKIRVSKMAQKAAYHAEASAVVDEVNEDAGARINGKEAAVVAYLKGAQASGAFVADVLGGVVDVAVVAYAEDFVGTVAADWQQ